VRGRPRVPSLAEPLELSKILSAHKEREREAEHALAVRLTLKGQSKDGAVGRTGFHIAVQ
jgi:hypothetical protein